MSDSVDRLLEASYGSGWLAGAEDALQRLEEVMAAGDGAQITCEEGIAIVRRAARQAAADFKNE